MEQPWEDLFDSKVPRNPQTLLDVRELFKEFVGKLQPLLPPCANKTKVREHLEEAAMRASKALTHG